LEDLLVILLDVTACRSGPAAPGDIWQRAGLGSGRSRTDDPADEEEGATEAIMGARHRGSD